MEVIQEIPIARSSLVLPLEPSDPAQSFRFQPYGDRGRQEFLANQRAALPYRTLIDRHELLTTHNSDQFNAHDLAYDRLDAFVISKAPMDVGKLVDANRAHTQGPRQGPRLTADFYIFHSDDFDRVPSAISGHVVDDARTRKKQNLPW